MANRLGTPVNTGIFGGTVATAHSGTFTSPAGAVTNPCIAIAVLLGDGVATGATISSVTVTPNGGSAVAATLVAGAVGGTPGTDNQAVAIYRLVGITILASTQYTVDITLAAAQECWGYAELLEDVNQSSPTRDGDGTRNNNLGTGLNISLTVDTEAGDLAFSGLSNNGTTAMTDAGDQTDIATNATSDYKAIGVAAGVSPSRTIAYTNVTANTIVALAAAVFQSPAGGSPPTITDVDTDEVVTDGQANVAVTGTNLSGATFAIIDGSLSSSQTVDSTTATTAQIDIVLGSVRYGARTLRATTGDGTGDIGITLNPASDKSYVDLGTPNTTAANRITAVADLASGDQLEISNVVGGTIADVTVNTDATFDCAESVESFDVRANDGTGWGTAGTQTVSSADNIPDPFDFTDQSNVALSSVITSDPITVQGIDAPADISVTDGEYDINASGSFTSAAGTVDEGDTVRARHTSSASYSTATGTIITIGGVSGIFTSTTIPDPSSVENYVGGVAVSQTGVMQTIFLEDAEDVPFDAVFIDGIAHSSSGQRYVAHWPVSGIVSHSSGRAVRTDGAQCIVEDFPDVYLAGFGYTSRGELCVTTLADSNFVQGISVNDGLTAVSNLN